MIVLAEISDAKELTEIALESNSFWGYTDEILESWTQDLTVSECIIKEMIVYKLNSVGFYILNQPKEESIELEFLFVLPNFIRKGIGSQLISHAFEQAKLLNCKLVTLLVDSNAVPFYESKGFKIIDKKESSITDRFLIVMEKDLLA
tara:strand:+ start:29352 stop:29792 length:441 start_codon:yes stop_codon:yes gene_type:complete